VLLILRLSHSSILMRYWFSGYLILVYWCVINSQVTSFQHTDVLLILRLPHYSILMYYWFSGDLIPAYLCVIDSQVISFLHTDVLLILRLPHSSILMCYWFSGDLIPAFLICYWFSGYLILAYWCVIDSQVTSFQHTDVLLILRLPHSSILMCFDFQVTSF
jgi:hypothetical protein